MKSLILSYHRTDCLVVISNFWIMFPIRWEKKAFAKNYFVLEFKWILLVYILA